MRLKLAAKIIIMVLLCCGVGFVSGFLTKNAITDWYSMLQKPRYTPPSWAFGVVWPILYVLMGIAAGIVWNKPTGRKAAMTALRLFLLQLLLNGLWTPLFFGLHYLDWALVDLMVLWAVLLVTTIVFYVQSEAAGLLLTPYLVWVSFAVYLNAGFWYLNR